MKTIKYGLLICLAWALIFITLIVIKSKTVDADYPDAGIEVVGKSGQSLITQNVFYRIVDKETGVVYLFIHANADATTTPCYNADGSLMTWDE